MKAWVVTWEAAGDAAAVADTVAAILSGRWSPKRVASHVEFLYLLKSSTAEEVAEYAARPARNPHRAQIDNNGRISCGHNPFLCALLADDVMVSTEAETGLEVVSWVDPGRFALGEDGVVVRETPPRPVAVHRRVRGPLNSRPIWDRSRGSFKPGWGPGEVPGEEWHEW